MRILIIGGTRFIGPYVVSSLHQKGHEITVFHRGKTKSELPSGVNTLHGDRRQLTDFRKELRSSNPDIVLDMIPIVEQDAISINEVFKGVAQRVVAVSSQDVYRAYGVLNNKEPGPADPVPLTEKSPLRQKLYPYRGENLRDSKDPLKLMDDYDKILIERVYLKNPDLHGTILRLPMVYGPGDYQHRLFEFLKRMDDSRPVILLSESLAGWRWTRGYVENVASAISMAVVNNNAAGNIYNIGEQETLTMAEWGRKIGDAAGWHGKIMIVPDGKMPEHLLPGMNTSQQLVTDTSLLRSELKYSEHIQQHEALKRTIKWERANPPEKIPAGTFDYASEDTIIEKLDRIS
ncbi:MAG: hypothetical protein A2161_06415 [Candidatus Schekmanbacteria bacterium RBG_13_48_7]|uniref:NAD-dependent epimerase/dehydratase domain-containing protein n=1 Tax=Candidatus Schekmanbacteria bacterium RBG_13_48_7 TaxID=1817878 RepID=A0A1F7RUE1_9BACT|nr:MAG: hypothetical protein A2161_06415 [Candidatus Schekmanbacteria bacterium RBG_13_48_7]